MLHGKFACSEVSFSLGLELVCKGLRPEHTLIGLEPALRVSLACHSGQLCPHMIAE